MAKNTFGHEIRDRWSFFKWQITAGLIVLALALHFGWVHFHQRETYVSVMLLDCHSSLTQDQIQEGLEEGMGIDTGKSQVEVQSTLMLSDQSSGTYQMTSLSRFLADLGSEKLDVCGMLLEDFETYEPAGTWMDLNGVLPVVSEERLSEYLLRAEDGRIIGIRAEGLPGLGGLDCYASKDVAAAVGILYNTKRIEPAVRLLEFLAEG